MLGPLQGPSGCAQMLWRNSLDGYLRQILNARVYDVAVKTSAHCYFGTLFYATQSIFQSIILHHVWTDMTCCTSSGA